MNLSQTITDQQQLEALLSKPSDQSREMISQLEGDIVVLGAAGKMGPTLCMLLKKAATEKTVLAVSRFSDAAVRARLEAAGVKTIVADLSDRSTFASLPSVPNVWYMAGMKFGASGNEPLTWAMNVYVPALTSEHFADSRIVALSTGNVYPFVDPASAGAAEDAAPGPIGEYAQSCLGRERIFQHFSARNGTPVVLVRLNYANEPRYGVIVDITEKIIAGEPVDLTMGYVNLIWQGDANDYIARAITLAGSPAQVLNVAGLQVVSVRELAQRIATILNAKVEFTGEEAATALLSNAGRCVEAFGQPSVGLDEMIETIVGWVAAGRGVLGRPTKFQARNGKF